MLHYYVADQNPTASDSNPGTSPSAPWKTVNKAIQVLDAMGTVTEDVVIHIGRGTYAWTEVLGPLGLRANIFFIGDGAYQAGDDGFIELSTGAAQAGSDITKLVGLGLVENAFLGKTLVMTSGAANGDRRTIRNNTQADIVPAAYFTAAVAVADTYRIVEPAVEFQVTTQTLPLMAAAPPSISNVGANGGFPPQWYNMQPGFAVHMINVRLGASAVAQPGVACWTFHGATVAFAGVELIAQSTQFFVLQSDNQSFVRAGFDSMYFGMNFLLPFTAGLTPSQTAWRGWGLTQPVTTDASIQIPNLMGYVVLPTIYMYDGCWWIFGGTFYSTAATASTVTVRHGSLTLGHWLAARRGNPVLLVHTFNNDIRSAVINAAGGFVNLQHVRIEKTNRGCAVLAQGAGDHEGTAPGVVSIAGDSGLVTIIGITGVETPSYGLVVRGGGRINWLNGYLVMSGTFPADQQTAAFSKRLDLAPPDVKQDLSAYLADGDSIVSNDGSRIERF